MHLGHIELGRWLYGTQAFAAIHYVVGAVPPHRQAPRASAAQRVRMMELAVADCDGLYADARELRRAGPSYTLDTLAEVRAEIGPQQPMALIMGEDAFVTLPTWRRWQELPELAHLVVLRRGEVAAATSASQNVADVLAALALEQVPEAASLTSSPAGMIWQAQQPLHLEEATTIRAAIEDGLTSNKLADSLPPAVAAYIKAENLYQA